jgi:hypothetical protein
MKIEKVVMLWEFASEDEYEGCKAYAAAQKHLIYFKDTKMQLFVSPAGYEDINTNAAKWRPNALSVKSSRTGRAK